MKEYQLGPYRAIILPCLFHIGKPKRGKNNAKHRFRPKGYISQRPQPKTRKDDLSKKTIAAFQRSMFAL